MRTFVRTLSYAIIGSLVCLAAAAAVFAQTTEAFVVVVNPGFQGDFRPFDQGWPAILTKATTPSQAEIDQFVADLSPPPPSLDPDWKPTYLMLRFKSTAALFLAATQDLNGCGAAVIQGCTMFGSAGKTAGLTAPGVCGGACTNGVAIRIQEPETLP